MVKENKRGNFFQIDKGVVSELADLGTNAMVSYVVLARGSSRSNDTSTWSVNAIEKKTGIGRVTAKNTLRKLAQAGLIERVKDGARPIYRLACSGDPDSWIWLPNSVVDGAVGEKPPLEKLRRQQSPAMIELFINLYDVQNLPEAGGIHWSSISITYTRKQIWESADIMIFGFDQDSLQVGPADFVRRFLARTSGTKEDFLAAWNRLENLGLIETATHLVEGKSDDAGIIASLEDRSNTVWYDLADAILSDTEAAGAMARYECVLAVPNWFPQVELVEVFRLRYRPHTSMTAAWIAKSKEYHDAESYLVGLLEEHGVWPS